LGGVSRVGVAARLLLLALLFLAPMFLGARDGVPGYAIEAGDGWGFGGYGLGIYYSGEPPAPGDPVVACLEPACYAARLAGVEEGRLVLEPAGPYPEVGAAGGVYRVDVVFPAPAWVLVAAAYGVVSWLVARALTGPYWGVVIAWAAVIVFVASSMAPALAVDRLAQPGVRVGGVQASIEGEALVNVDWGLLEPGGAGNCSVSVVNGSSYEAVGEVTEHGLRVLFPPEALGEAAEVQARRTVVLGLSCRVGFLNAPGELRLSMPLTLTLPDPYIVASNVSVTLVNPSPARVEADMVITWVYPGYSVYNRTIVELGAWGEYRVELGDASRLVVQGVFRTPWGPVPFEARIP